MNHLYVSNIDSPLGEIKLCANHRGISGVYFFDQKYVPDLEQQPTHLASPDQNEFIAQLSNELSAYFSGTIKQFDTPIDLSAGTEFQQRVWNALFKIPLGATLSYKQLALQLKLPNGARAVALANSRNPISIVVGCHRVLGSDGNLRGYAGGIERKDWLLNLEKHYYV